MSSHITIFLVANSGQTLRDLRRLLFHVVIIIIVLDAPRAQPEELDDLIAVVVANRITRAPLVVGHPSRSS